MIPKKIIRLDLLSLNGNGKVDENLLFKSLSVLNTDEENNSDYLETKKYLLNLWSDILQIDKLQLSENSDFIRLGDTSLDVMKLGVELLQKKI